MRYNPDDYPHPGESLLLELEEIGLSQKAFAHYIHENADLIGEICTGKAPMTPLIAIKISRALGGPPRKWLELQTNHDLARVDERDYSHIRQLGSDPEED